MLICLCKGIRESEVKQVIRGGAGSIEEVGRRCGAGTACCGCHAELHYLLRAHSKKAAHAAPAAPAQAVTPHKRR